MTKLCSALNTQSTAGRQYIMHILFVCWGNICRSPSAEATFRKLLKNRGLEGKITCDSAGTIGQHHGKPPDPRMQKAAQARSLTLSGTARMVTDEDFEKSVALLTMDDFNFSELSSLAPSSELTSKIKPFCSYVSNNVTEVPDPYFGGAEGFETVLDLLEEGCTRLLDELERQLTHSS
jgi:protein-tyrosine phosphatase